MNPRPQDYDSLVKARFYAVRQSDVAYVLHRVESERQGCMGKYAGHDVSIQANKPRLEDIASSASFSSSQIRCP